MEAGGQRELDARERSASIGQSSVAWTATVLGCGHGAVERPLAMCPGARPGTAGGRRGRSSRSGATRRCRPRCRRGSTRGTAAGRAIRGRSGTSRSSRTPAGGRRRRAARSRPAAGEVGGDVAQPHLRCPNRSGTRRCSPPRPRVPVPERLDDQVVDREPDRPAPVGVAAEQAGGRLAGLVVDAGRRARRGRAGTARSRWRLDSARSPYGDEEGVLAKHLARAARRNRAGGTTLIMSLSPARAPLTKPPSRGRSSVTSRPSEEAREALAEGLAPGDRSGWDDRRRQQRDERRPSNGP